MIQRRTFLQRLATLSATVCAAGTPYGLARLLAPASASAHDDPRTHLRPPGALQEDQEFIAACIGCGLCGDVCPVGAIRFYDRSGGDKINTPFVDPVRKGCTLCGACMEICPTESLVETPKEEVKMGYAQIDRTACYPWVGRGICGACVPVCPLGSAGITFDFYRPVVQHGCVGCGVCVEVCPHPSLPIAIVSRALGRPASVFTAVPQTSAPANDGLLPF